MSLPLRYWGLPLEVLELAFEDDFDELAFEGELAFESGKKELKKQKKRKYVASEGEDPEPTVEPEDPLEEAADLQDLDLDLDLGRKLTPPSSQATTTIPDKDEAHDHGMSVLEGGSNYNSPSSSTAAATHHIVARILGATDPKSSRFDIRAALSTSRKVASPVVGKTHGGGPTSSFRLTTFKDLGMEELSLSAGDLAGDLAAFKDLRDEQAVVEDGPQSSLWLLLLCFDIPEGFQSCTPTSSQQAVKHKPSPKKIMLKLDSSHREM
eukprot:gene10977-17089_t